MSGWGTTLVGYASAVNLLQSIRMEFGDGAVFVVGPTVKYAVWHEIGTSKMQARPFARPAAERVQADPEAMYQRYQSAAPNAGPVEVMAIAVQNEMKRIADQKGIRDTGDLIASISVEKVS